MARLPDEMTIWLFRELLVRAGVIDKLFDRFEAELEGQGCPNEKSKTPTSTVTWPG